MQCLSICFKFILFIAGDWVRISMYQFLHGHNKQRLADFGVDRVDLVSLFENMVPQNPIVYHGLSSYALLNGRG